MSAYALHATRKFPQTRQTVTASTIGQTALHHRHRMASSASANVGANGLEETIRAKQTALPHLASFSRSISRQRSTLALRAPSHAVEQDIVSGRAIQDLVSWAKSFRMPSNLSPGVAWLPRSTELSYTSSSLSTTPPMTVCGSDCSASFGAGISVVHAPPSSTPTSTLKSASSNDGGSRRFWATSPELTTNRSSEYIQANQAGSLSEPTVNEKLFDSPSPSLYSRPTHQSPGGFSDFIFDFNTFSPICEEPSDIVLRRMSGQVEEVEKMFKGLNIKAQSQTSIPTADSQQMRFGLEANGRSYSTTTHTTDASNEQQTSGLDCVKPPISFADRGMEDAVTGNWPAEPVWPLRRSSLRITVSSSISDAEERAEEYRRILSGSAKD